MPPAVDKLAAFWRALGANVETMTPEHHDLVLAITSHLPHLIAYTIVGTADELQNVTRSEVLKFSAGGFRDFTRIAASDPTMWRDVFLANKDAVLEMLGRFNEDISALTRAIRNGDGDALFEHFTRTRAIRKGIRRYRPGFAGAGFRPPHPDLPHEAVAEALRVRRLEQRRRRSERDRAEIGNTILEHERQVTAWRPSSVVACPSMSMPAERLVPACSRATLPSPGDSRSSMPAILSTVRDLRTISGRRWRSEMARARRW